MSHWKRAKFVFTFLGTLIGAGFATGREIALYFGNLGISAPLLAGACFGALSFMFLELGRLSRGGWASTLFPRAPYLPEGVISTANAAVFCAMVAGAETIISGTFSIYFGGLISAILCLFVLAGGNRGVQAINTLLVPLLLAFFAFLFFRSTPAVGWGFSLISPVGYAAMNALTGGVLAADMAKENTRRDNAVIALWVGILLSLLCAAVYAAVLPYKGEEMPLFTLASNLNLPVLGGVLIYLSILTTMAGSLAVAARHSMTRASAVTVIGLLLAPIGFGKLVGAIYPVVGVLGVMFCALCAFRLWRMRRDRQSFSPIFFRPSRARGASAPMLKKKARALDKTAGV